MTSPHWQLNHPVSAVVFDCDGTLNELEGIDYLAAEQGVGKVVEKITADAMSKTGLNPELYKERLLLVNPHQTQVLALGQAYFAKRVPDIEDIIKLLKRLNKSIYLVSAGINPAVKTFGELLDIPTQNIYAVDVVFGKSGEFLDFEKNSPLIDNGGKRTIISHLKKSHDTIIHVGDGLNDLVTHDLVTRFVGYGGVFYRENIANQCHFYIRTLSLAPILPLSLTAEEITLLTP